VRLTELQNILTFPLWLKTREGIQIIDHMAMPSSELWMHKVLQISVNDGLLVVEVENLPHSEMVGYSFEVGV
jgi:hypothetical protein